MIVHRQLCYGILEGWNQDPATSFYSFEYLRHQRFCPL